MDADDPIPANYYSDCKRIKPIHQHSLYHLLNSSKLPSENLVIDSNLKPDLAQAMQLSDSKSKNFSTKNFPLQRPILGSWLREGSLGFIFGLRGAGKTWFAWDMAISISKGQNFGPWQCSNPWRTIYVDGEMSMRSMQERLNLLEPDPSDNLSIFPHEEFVRIAKIPLNLCNPDIQKHFLQYCLQEKVKVVFLDNLSCLCRGMKENYADSWEQIVDWLLNFRDAGIAVIIIHHANREGNDMRGTSRREDLANWIIKVSPNFKFADIENGTAFSTEFTKNRDDDGAKENPLDWTFVTQNNHTTVTWKTTDMTSLVYKLIRVGIESNGGIAQELGVSNGTVSKCAKKLITEGKIRKDGLKYTLP